MDTYQTGSSPNRLLTFLVGFAVGVVVVAGFLYLRSNFFTKEEPSELKVTTKEFILSLSSPKDGETVSSATINISGTTGVASIVVINGGSDDVILEAKKGDFTTPYKLVLGENQLTLTAYEQRSGDSRTQSVNILYLNENLEDL